MPIDPRTWTALDYWLATVANGDLCRFSSQEFSPTGIGFHARRPVYKAYSANAGPSTAAGAWVGIFKNGSSNNVSTAIGDTGGLFGAFMDPFGTGNFRLQVAGGGGLPASAGGLALVFGQSLWPSMTAADATQAALDVSTATTPTANNRGAIQQANINRFTCAYCLDVIDINSQRWAMFGLNGGAAAHTPPAPDNTDGSGRASRLHSVWASVYPANGHTAASLPAPLSSWTGQSLTASLMNGNTGIRDVLRFLNMPPLLRVQGAGGQSLTGGVANVVSLGTTTYDTYSGWNSGTNTYTVPMSGLYLVYGTVSCQNFGGSVRVGAMVNGTTNIWGPYSPMPTSGNGGGSKVQILSLNAGDTVKLVAWPTLAATSSTGNLPRLVMAWLGKAGTPSPLPTVPDTSYRWAAGTPGDLTSVFNAHVANDLTYLIQRPYLMAYQTVAQTGIAMSTATRVNMDTIQGIVHADAGDNYSGWDSVNKRYVAPRSGWYLAVEEMFLAQPTLTTSPAAAAVFQPNPAGAGTWDFAQIQNMSTSAITAPGAGGITLYYLRAGDTLTPGVWTIDSSATTIATAVSTPNNNSHFELIWLGE